jgi:hypothetical protein
MALGAPVGFFVGFFVGSGIRGIGFGDEVGLAEATGVGAFDWASDGIAVAFIEGAILGLLEMEGAVVFRATGAVVGTRVGAIVPFISGMMGDNVGTSLIVILLIVLVGVGAVVCAMTVIIIITHCKIIHVHVLAVIADVEECCMLYNERILLLLFIM